MVGHRFETNQRRARWWPLPSPTTVRRRSSQPPAYAPAIRICTDATKSNERGVEESLILKLVLTYYDLFSFARVLNTLDMVQTEPVVAAFIVRHVGI